MIKLEVDGINVEIDENLVTDLKELYGLDAIEEVTKAFKNLPTDK